jgi:1,4-alpha-glucan branching enzyme
VLFLTPGVIVFAAFAGAVLSCAGATGKVLVPGSGSDDLLTTDEPAAAGPAQPEEEEEEEEESQVHSHL